MSTGNLSQKQIAKKYGCSVPALQLWRKELQKASSEDSWDDDEEWVDPEEEAANVAATPPPKPKESCNCATKSTKSAHEIIRKFWDKNYRGVDMLLTPKTIGSSEVVKLVNEAIQFAIDHK